MPDSFDILEEKVKKAADLVKKLRRENRGLDDQLKESRAKVLAAEENLAALEARTGDSTDQAGRIQGLTVEIEALKSERDEVRTRVARIVSLLESLD